MSPKELAIELSRNLDVLNAILKDISNEFVNFKPIDNAWSPLIIICHLLDEEVEDFRARIKHFHQNPDTTPLNFNPEAWVISRKYEEQNFEEKLNQWKTERKASIKYLRSIEHIDTAAGYDHKEGRFTIQLLLDNWLAHDLLHIRQLTRLRYQFLNQISNSSLKYAGQWQEKK